MDHTRDLASKTIPAREAGIGTDSDASDHEQASEMEPTSAGTNAADNIGNSRADEERDKAVRSVAEATGRRTLRARPVAPKVQNEYARPYKTTAAARRERRPNIINQPDEVEAEESERATTGRAGDVRHLGEFSTPLITAAVGDAEHDGREGIATK